MIEESKKKFFFGNKPFFMSKTFWASVVFGAICLAETTGYLNPAIAAPIKAVIIPLVPIFIREAVGKGNK